MLAKRIENVSVAWNPGGSIIIVVIIYFFEYNSFVFATNFLRCEKL